MPVNGRDPFEYAILRVVPRVERGECFNAGIVLHCRAHRFLAARVALDPRRLIALAEEVEPAEVQPYLDAAVRIAAGAADAGPIARLAQAQRFHWLVSPASTIIQPSPIHTGLCDDPAAMLDHLFETLVLPAEATGPTERVRGTGHRLNPRSPA